MALTYVQITGTFDDGTGQPVATGSVTFTPSQIVYASGIPVVTPSNPIQAQIISGALKAPGGAVLQLLATGNNGLTVEGRTGFWYWTVAISITSGGGTSTDGWSFFLPVSPVTVDLYTLANTPALGYAAGTVLLNGATPVAVSAPTLAAGHEVFLTTQIPGGTPGSPYVTSKTPGSGFSVASTNALDTSTAAWVII